MGNDTGPYWTRMLTTHSMEKPVLAIGYGHESRKNSSVWGQPFMKNTVKVKQQLFWIDLGCHKAKEFVSSSI